MDEETYAGAEKDVGVPTMNYLELEHVQVTQYYCTPRRSLCTLPNANGTAWIEMTANGKIDFCRRQCECPSKGDSILKQTETVIYKQEEITI